MLTPLLVTGHGRSGTTALMSLLGTSPDVAFDRVYAYEHRQLTYIAKMAMVADRADRSPHFTDARMRDFDDPAFGPAPWPPGGLLASGSLHLFPHLWHAMSRQIATTENFYAEKSPAWLAAFVTRYVDAYNLCLFRDPRDIYLSAMAFMRRRGNFDFGRSPADSDLDYARNLSFRWLNLFEAWRMDRENPRNLLVRYEDFRADPASLASVLKDRVNLAVNPASIEVFPAHITSERSVERYRAEPIPAEVLETFSALLGEEMSLLNYPISAPPRADRALPTLVHPSAHGRIEKANERSLVAIDGPDYFGSLPVEPFEARTVHSLWLCVRATVGDHCAVYWRSRDESLSEERVVYAHYHPGDHWRVLRFDVHAHERWTGEIVELRLDLFNSHGAFVPGTCEVTWLRFVLC
jgi:hypothetical protein